jgi:hypothetical protein
MNKLGLAMLAAVPLVFVSGAGAADAQPAIEAVTLHRVFEELYSCTDHFEGEFTTLGDARGTDCVVQGGLPDAGLDQKGFARPFRDNGLRNEDWYGWNVRVLAPCDGVVEHVHVNSIVNRPGEMGTGPASHIVVRRADGMRVMLAHLQDIQVREGDTVRAGEFIARVGNNGYSRNPHVHVAAWKDDAAYQIRWDLRSRRIAGKGGDGSR